MTREARITWSLVALAVGAMLWSGLADVADAQRRQAATSCIETWHAWVRGTYTPIRRAEAEWCSEVAGIPLPDLTKLDAAMEVPNP